MQSGHLRANNMTAQAHKTLSSTLEVVKSIAKGTSDNPSAKKEVKASWGCNSSNM